MAHKTQALKSVPAHYSVLEKLLNSVSNEDKKHGFSEFLKAFWQYVPPQDLEDYSSEELLEAAQSIWRFGQLRKPGQARVRVHNPPLSKVFQYRETVVEVVADDMPFQVDSITNELYRMGMNVHLSIYPVVYVKRDKTGHVKGASIEPDKDAALETYMMFRIDRHTAPEQLALVVSNIERVMESVRLVVSDWKPMQERIQEALADMKNVPATISEKEKTETAAFLQWLMDNHFILMGYREYTFTERNKKTSVKITPGLGLGLMRDDNFVLIQNMRELEHQPEALQDYLKSPTLLLVTKGDRQSTVHRAAHFDRIGIKIFDQNGKVVGERLFAGLLTSSAYSERPSEIPFIRQKVAHVVKRAGFASNGHNGKALVHILDIYPRDELFQISEEQLFENALGIMHLQDRQKTAVFLRRDAFGRFTSALVYFPRDRFNTAVRNQIETILERALHGKCTARTLRVDEGPLAQLHLIVSRVDEELETPDTKALTAELTELSRGWLDRLHDALTENQDENEEGTQLFHYYNRAFPASYQENISAEDAVHDIAKLEEARGIGGLAVSLRNIDGQYHFKTYHPQTQLALSNVLPMLENFGLKVVSSVPYQITVQSRLDGKNEVIWLDDFLVEAPAKTDSDIAQRMAEVETAFLKAWRQELGKDQFNALILLAGLTWREVYLMRALSRYLRQVRLPYSQDYVAEALCNNPAAAHLIIKLFHANHDPDLPESERASMAASVMATLENALTNVSSLDEDRILRRYLNLVQSILRTNYYQTCDGGKPKSYISLKFNSAQIEDLPLPRPMIETFTYSPRVEGIHLRTSKVARGGIRWSDRREDYRDEVLGLMKAQNVKNSIIVPSGAKGGFFVKMPPVTGGRDALQKEGIECYRIFVRGLLDIADNLVNGKLVPPQRVICHDSSDHYIVVAADKGTATFSDIANGLAQEYGFWMDDAFASGGSSGYDHKGMGITARGGWESVKRHFREIGKDIQAEDFTVVGVGGMAGDVFGNGMLLSPHIQLLAAFNHAEIFCDPNPDPAKSFEERKRLFHLPGSLWKDYDASKLSGGGRIFDRNAKILKLTPEICQRFDIARDEITPSELIKAVLRAQVELLWFGGIGTYVKASTEMDASILDKANDPIRINANELRCAVIGEGANLGMSQLGRVQYARAGGRLNTDFIDNSAGVDTSDHEVNIKILFRDLMQAKRITRPDRDKLLAQMTDDVAELVLNDNYQQTQALTVAQTLAPDLIDHHIRYMHYMERNNLLDRRIEFLPDDAELAERRRTREGLTRPELAVLLSYSKINLKHKLLQSNLFHDKNDEVLHEELLNYFPARLQKLYSDAIIKHSLRNELITTSLTTTMVNRMGISFARWIMDRTGCDAADLMRAFMAARKIFDLDKTWNDIEALDGIIPASVQMEMMIQIIFLNNRVLPWILRQAKTALAIVPFVEKFQKDIKTLQRCALDCLSETRSAAIAAHQKALADNGVPEALALKIALLPILAMGLDLSSVAEKTEKPLKIVAETYFKLADRFGFDWLQEQVIMNKSDDYWQRQSYLTIQEDFSEHLAALTKRVLKDAAKAKYKDKDILESWIADNETIVSRIDGLLADLHGSNMLDLAILSVISRRLRGYFGG